MMATTKEKIIPYCFVFVFRFEQIIDFIRDGVSMPYVCEYVCIL